MMGFAGWAHFWASFWAPGKSQETDGFQDSQMIDFWSILDPFWDQKNVVSICILQCFVDFSPSAKGTPSRIDFWWFWSHLGPPKTSQNRSKWAALIGGLRFWNFILMNFGSRSNFYRFWSHLDPPWIHIRWWLSLVGPIFLPKCCQITTVTAFPPEKSKPLRRSGDFWTSKMARCP